MTERDGASLLVVEIMFTRPGRYRTGQPATLSGGHQGGSCDALTDTRLYGAADIGGGSRVRSPMLMALAEGDTFRGTCVGKQKITACRW